MHNFGDSESNRVNIYDRKILNSAMLSLNLFYNLGAKSDSSSMITQAQISILRQL